MVSFRPLRITICRSTPYNFISMDMVGPPSILRKVGDARFFVMNAGAEHGKGVVAVATVGGRESVFEVKMGTYHVFYFDLTLSRQIAFAVWVRKSMGVLEYDGVNNRHDSDRREDRCAPVKRSYETKAG